jgi:hypothetical protein
MPKVTPSAYDLKESALKGTHADVKTYEDLAKWLCDELDIAISSRGPVAEDIRYGWTLYEQGRTRGKNAPWPDAADLTSPYAAEYVDALHARVMQTVFQEPVWTVEGWGESAPRAPFVEEFHQRTQEDERLQSYLDECLLRTWIEPAGILEVSEAIDMRRTRGRINAKLALDPATQAPIMGEDNVPVFEQDDLGNPIEADQQAMAAAEIDVDRIEPVRTGPDYDVIPYLDFLTLPHHARHKGQVWGYAKRFKRRVPELAARAKQGIYDKQAVEECGAENETDATSSDVVIPDQKGPTAQKELWQVQFLADLDGKGERWYIATVHKDKRLLLRLKFDDQTTRYIRFVPFPKPGSVDGYSLVMNKLITVIEEDTAVRNMRADKAALAISAPIKVTTGALWDPYEQPFGPRSVITVRDQNEIQQMELSDVPPSINVWKNDIRQDADRLAGQNDTSFGQSAAGDATLGEVRLKAGYVEVRIDLVVKRLKEPMEELFQARHNVWKRVLKERQTGLPIPQSMAMGLEARGIPVDSVSSDGRITAEMLEGQFWGKPRGSVESADLNARMGYFNQGLTSLTGLASSNPTIAMIMQSPSFAKAILEEWMRVHRWQDKQALLGPEVQQMIQQQQQQAALMQDPRMQTMMAMMQGGPMGGQMEMPQPGAPQQPPQAPGLM